MSQKGEMEENGEQEEQVEQDDQEEKPLKKPKSLQDQYESNFVKQILKDFDAKESEAWRKLTSRFGEKLNQNKILSLAEVCSNKLGLNLFREYKRRKEMLIKWFDMNLDQVWPFIEHHIHVVDVNGNEL